MTYLPTFFYSVSRKQKCNDSHIFIVPLFVLNFYDVLNMSDKT